jgi:uncharacterized membrane protein/ribosomal protein L32
MTEQYKVVFSGQLQAGYDLQQVKRDFSEKFNIDLGKAEKLLSTSKDVILKGGLDKKRAEKYKRALEKIGLVVKIEGKPSEDLPSGLSLEPVEIEDGEVTQVFDSRQLSALQPNCPKCGSTKMENGICQDCGIVAEKYRAFQAKTKKDEEEETPDSDSEEVSSEDDEEEMLRPIAVPAGHGMAWLGQGWWHFRQNPFAWILALIVWVILAMATSLIPLLGGIVVNLLSPVFTAGFLIGCRAQDDGEDFTVGHLFSGFSNNPGQLILVGLIYLGAMMLLVIALTAGLFSLMGQDMMSAQNPEMMIATVTSPVFLVVVLLGLLLIIPVMMAYLFAPALVALEEMKAWEAMKLSFSACMKNILPFTLYGFLAMLLMFIGSVPVGLGLLIVLPMLIASLYASYQDIFYS